MLYFAARQHAPDNGMLTGLYSGAINGIYRFTNGERWRMKTTAALVLLSLVFQFPHYNYFVNALRGRETNALWQNVERQSQHPFTYTPQPPGTHMEKTAFRLTVPLLAKALHLNFLGVYLLQFLLGILLIYFTLDHCYNLCRDKAVAVLFAGGLAFIYPGACAFADVWAQFDAFGYVFLFFAIYFVNPFAVFGAALLACFSDERALIASSLVVLFHVYGLQRTEATNDGRVRLNRQAMAMMASWVVYFAIRIFMTQRLGFKTTTGRIGAEVFFAQLGQLEWGLWSGLEGAWLLVLAFLAALLVKRYYMQALLFFSCLAVVCLAATMVTDATRSMAYGFVILYAAFAFLNAHTKPDELMLLLFGCCLVSFLHPMYFTLGESVIYPVHSVFVRGLEVLRMFLYKTQQ